MGLVHNTTDAAELARQAWDGFDFDLAWAVSWKNIPAVYKSTRPYPQEPSLQGLVDSELAKAFPYGEEHSLVGAAVLCGDMRHEREFFRDRYRAIRFQQVHGYDLSPKNLDAAGEVLDFEFVPHKVDCNNLVMEKNRYHFIVGHHGIHHVYNVSNLFFQCNQGLKPGGLLYVEEYIGPRYLQTPFANYWISRLLLVLLFSKRERTTHENRLKGKWMHYAPGMLDISEACNSEVIEKEMLEYFEPVHILRYGGLCYPMLEGLGRNFDSGKGAWRFRFLIYLERALQHLKIIKPMFLQAILKKKEVW